MFKMTLSCFLLSVFVERDECWLPPAGKHPRYFRSYNHTYL